MSATRKSSTLLDKFLRDKGGNIVVAQVPNIPILGWLICTTVAHIVHSSATRAKFDVLSAALLFTWSYLELTQGASYFRRALGVVVMLWVIISRLF